MPASINLTLVFAATLSAMAALLHVGIVFGGPAWYRFFGAGEQFASAAAAGRAYPGVVTAGIALVLGLWSAYALSGAGVLPRWPLLPAALCAITGIYLLRGLAVLPLLVFARPKATPFLVWSSLVCLGFGLVHLLGLLRVWPRL